MEVARWQRIERLLDALDGVCEDEREAHLARICPDPELRREVLSLCAAEVASRGYLDGLAERLGRASGAAELPDLSGRRIGVYRLRRQLGRGGMGVVYEAERADGAFDQRVALKLLTAAPAGSEAHERFLAERRILAGLEHPAIAHIVDGGITEDGTPWFAMEHVEGEPIDAYCDRRRLGLRERLRLFLQVCDAVDHAHRRLVVHRDLKPANVLVTEEGRVKLLDFGIAGLLRPDDAPASAASAAAASRSMTPEYASPEQVRGEAIATASDVYQLGLLLYELLVGRGPRGMRVANGGEPGVGSRDRAPLTLGAALAQHEVLEQAGRTRGLSAKGLRRQLRGDLESIVDKALDEEPECRYGSSDRLAQDVRRYLAGQPVAARPGAWTYRGRKFLGRHAVGAAGVAVALIVAAAMTGVYTVRIQSERDRAQAEAAKAHRVSQFLTGLFRGADPREARSTELSARALLDRGVAQVERELAAQPELRADMLHVLGRTYLEIGRHDTAERLLTRALRLRRRHFGRRHLEVGRTLGDLGLLRYHQGEYERARERLREAVGVLEEVPGASPSDLVPVLRTLGRTHRILGEHEAGLSVLRRASRLQSRTTGEASAPAAELLTELGNLLYDMGRVRRAEDLYERALTIQERVLGADHPLVGTTLMRLAIVRTAMGDRAGVEAMYRRNLAIQTKAYGPIHNEVGTALNNLGHYLMITGRNDEAIEVFERALDVHVAALGPSHPGAAYPLANLGDIHQTQGRPEAARHYYERGVGLLEQAGGEGGKFDTLLFHSLVGLAQACSAAGDLPAAEAAVRRALAAWRRSPAPNDPRLVPSLTELARWLGDAGRCAEAVPLVRRAMQISPASAGQGTPRAPELERLLARCSAPGPSARVDAR